MVAHQNGGPQTGRAVVAGDGRGDAHGRVSWRAGGSEGGGAKPQTAARQASAQTAQARAELSGARVAKYSGRRGADRNVAAGLRGE